MKLTSTLLVLLMGLTSLAGCTGTAHAQVQAGPVSPAPGTVAGPPPWVDRCLNVDEPSEMGVCFRAMTGRPVSAK
jgi:hypothetical protein